MTERDLYRAALRAEGLISKDPRTEQTARKAWAAWAEATGTTIPLDAAA